MVVAEFAIVDGESIVAHPVADAKYAVHASNFAPVKADITQLPA